MNELIEKELIRINTPDMSIEELEELIKELEDYLRQRRLNKG